jgi:formate hydrogenlyase subunit 3/multisubunit Na+/H+ antiporter MnhD subunit
MGVAVSLLGALPVLFAAGKVLWTTVPIAIVLPWQIPLASFHMTLDPLAAFFVLVICVTCMLAAVYGVGYLSAYTGRRRLGAAWCFYNLLFASMLLVVMARNAVLFLMAWEAMSLTSFFLVMFEHEDPAVREAGWTYLTAAHLGAACLLAMFVLMAGPHGNLDFDHVAPPSGPLAAGILFILAVLGFGAKAGFLPLHVWLPEAHPAAPSHVSAVMSGVMIKTGIYGLIRVASLLGPPAPWWGWALIVIGAASGIMGVLSAICQHDLKRLLAYHSVENIGIISLGLGLWLLGSALGQPVLACLGLLGGLLHVLNHSLFKSLLFLGAGAVKQATHTLEIDRLGGLCHRMPHTALSFLIGSVAICGLPPFNGFVSEFLIYLGAFTGVVHSQQGILAAAGLTTLLSLGLIGGLATVCFTKVYGVVFSGEPRTLDAARAQETPAVMGGPMAVLAGLCLLLGLAAPVGVSLAAPAAGMLLGESVMTNTLTAALPLLRAIGLGGGAIIVLALLLSALRKGLLAGRKVASGVTWDCGYLAPDARMQYTASSYAQPVLDMFRWVVRPRVHRSLDPGAFPGQASFSSHTRDPFRQHLFLPLFRLVEALARSFHRLQQGRNQLYVLYIAIAILALLLLEVR